MKVLVTGYNGQLGYDVIEKLNSLHVECKGVDIADFSLRDEVATKAYISAYKPDVIVHCAAFTDVDKAVEDKDLCYEVNVLGTKYVAEVAKDIDAKMVYISTDYVFPGDGENYYEVDDVTAPINYYGMTKWQGEEVVRSTISDHFIIRISWVFGVNGNNFIKTMLRLAKTRDELSVVDDQIGSPTSTYDLAVLITNMIQTEKYGTYHATNEGVCSWFEFAEEIFRIAGMSVKVNQIPSEDYPLPAVRPMNSRMSKKSLEDNGFEKLPTWQDATRRYVAEL